MKRTALGYGISLAVLLMLLKFVEYRFLVRDLSIEFYIGLVALFFTSLGVWAGFRLTRKKIILTSLHFVLNEIEQKQRGISNRELEVLGLMAKGYSNLEIANELSISLNTIKTHLSNLFIKLDVKRRTQAVQLARDLRLIP